MYDYRAIKEELLSLYIECFSHNAIAATSTMSSESQTNQTEICDTGSQTDVSQG